MMIWYEMMFLREPVQMLADWGYQLWGCYQVGYLLALCTMHVTMSVCRKGIVWEKGWGTRGFSGLVKCGTLTNILSYIHGSCFLSNIQSI